MIHSLVLWCVDRGVAFVWALLVDGCLICAVPRCTRTGAGVSANATDLVTPGGLGKMRREQRGSLQVEERTN